MPAQLLPCIQVVYIRAIRGIKCLGHGILELALDIPGRIAVPDTLVLSLHPLELWHHSLRSIEMELWMLREEFANWLLGRWGWCAVFELRKGPIIRLKKSLTRDE
jgi:hypothetical protein